MTNDFCIWFFIPQVTSGKHHSVCPTNVISTHGQKQPKTCSLPDHSRHDRKMSEKHLFPVYLEPKSEVDLRKQPFEHLQRLHDERTPPERDPSTGERFYLLKHDEDASFTDRPFTRKIDKIIAKEKITDGFLDAAQMFLSDMETCKFSEEGGKNFQPLVPDINKHFISQTNQHITDQEIRVGFESPTEVTGYSQLSNDKDFVDYYKNLGPEERRRELMAQKSALLEEQKRLKAVLMEQEQMLRSKQDHLHRQQEIQQNRLKHFENTGTFPPHHRYKQPVEAYRMDTKMETSSSNKMNDHVSHQPHSMVEELPPDPRKPPGFIELSPSQNHDICDNGLPVQHRHRDTSLYQHTSAHRPISDEHLKHVDGGEHFFEKQVAETRAVIAGQQQGIVKQYYILFNGSVKSIATVSQY